MPSDDVNIGLARLEERIEGMKELFNAAFNRVEATISELADRFNGDVDEFRESIKVYNDIPSRVKALEEAAEKQKTQVEALKELAAQSKVIRWGGNIAAGALAGALVRAIWK